MFYRVSNGGTQNYHIVITFSVWYSSGNFGARSTLSYDLIDGVLTNRQGSDRAYYKSGAFDMCAQIDSVVVTPL